MKARGTALSDPGITTLISLSWCPVTTDYFLSHAGFDLTTFL